VQAPSAAGRHAAVIRLPHAALEKPTLDPDRSYPVSRQCGILDRIGGFRSGNPGDQQTLDEPAVCHIARAARKSGLTARAEADTTAMLRGLLHFPRVPEGVRALRLSPPPAGLAAGSTRGPEH
jgi:Protein of unknown function (DUF4230)